MFIKNCIADCLSLFIMRLYAWNLQGITLNFNQSRNFLFIIKGSNCKNIIGWILFVVILYWN